MTKKTNVEDIIGLVQTDEPTNSVQLKKEAQLSICEKRIIELRKENKQLRIQLSEQGTQIDFLKDENHHMKHVLNENKQLKKRNTNQYQQLNQLWQLIEAKDWETLTEMDNQMKEDEERLQQEWRCYCE